jgi:membrane protease YdiL (CAAX protease family)
MVLLSIELVVSWILLWLFNKSNLLVLGLKPTKKRISDFAFGLLSSSILCGLCFYLVAKISNSKLDLNSNFTVKTFFNSSFWMLKSVLYEEFLFRGALLYIGIKKIGFKNACILSSVVFGIYHWFSYGIFGNIPQMIYIFILTGIGGLLFAFSYARTKSMWLPIGLHLGWNLISVVIFSQGPLGNQMLISSGGQGIVGIWYTIFFIYQITILPLVTYLYLRVQKYGDERQQQPT